MHFRCRALLCVVVQVRDFGGNNDEHSHTYTHRHNICYILLHREILCVHDDPYIPPSPSPAFLCFSNANVRAREELLHNEAAASSAWPARPFVDVADGDQDAG